MAKNNLVKIGGELRSVAADGVVAGTEAIYDYTENKSQDVINKDLKNAIEDIDVTDQISGKADKNEMSVVPGIGANADKTTITLKSGTSATVLTQHQDISGKVDKIAGKGLSTNDYTNEDKQKVAYAIVAADIAGKANASDVYTKSETYSNTEVNNLITTPNQEYVSVTATVQTAAVTDVLPATGAADTTYRVGNWDGTQYNDSVFSEYAWNGSAYIKLSTKSQVGEIYDISANHAYTKYSDLAAALGSNGANIPQSLRKGGMYVKFVQSSDNKYVQYRLMSDDWSTNTNDWAIADEGMCVKNPEFVYIKTDKEDKILWAIKPDGSIYYGAGVPPQVVDYIQQKIEELSLDEYEDIVTFLNGLEEGGSTLQQILDVKANKNNAKLTGKISLDKEISENDEISEASIQHVEGLKFVAVWFDKDDKILFGVKDDGDFIFGCGVPRQIITFVNGIKYELLNNLQPQINTLNNNVDALNNSKVDKVEGKSLIDSKFAASQSVVEDYEYMDIETDSINNILGGRKIDGTKFENLPFEIQGVRQETIDNSEFMEITTDLEGNIIEGIKKDGKYYEQVNIGYANIAHRLNFSQKARQRFIEDSGLHNGNWIVPPYWNVNNYLNNKIRVISDLIRKTIINGDAFYFVTDTHWERNQQHSPAIIKQMNRFLNIPKILHGGDIYHSGLGYDRYAIDCVNWFRYAIDIPNKAYFTDGNHEYINGVAKYGDVFAETRIFLEDVVFGGDKKNYYYFDNQPKKIRYICIYSYGEYKNGNYDSGYEDSDQMDWLANVALDVEEGWKIIIYTHNSIIYNLATSTVISEYSEPLFSVIDNYSGNGDIIAVISGHTHRDIVSLDTCRCPVIVSTCDHNDYTLERTEFSDLIEARNTGTIGEQAFDVVVFDSDNSIIHFCRIGSRALNRVDTFGGDAQVDYRSVFIESLTVGTSKALDTLLTGTITWRSSDSGIMSVSNGTVTANAAGVAAITASSDNGEIQSYFIKVI